MNIFFLAIFSYAIVEASGRNYRSIGGRIVGGEEIKIEEIPFQVSVRYFDFHFCGGSILSSKYIITAAHCFQNDIKMGFTVRAGSSRSDKGGSIHIVLEIKNHPKFNPILFDYDASILKLFNQINFDEFRKPIQLPYFGENTIEGTLVQTSGWGVTLNQNESMLGLRKVELKINNIIQCNKVYEEDGGITNRMICAYFTGRDACQGGKKDRLNFKNFNKILI
jgi:trypsin